MPLAALGLFGLTAGDWTGIVVGVLSVYLLFQQNQIFRRQNDIFAGQAGQSAMPKTPQTPWIARYWPTVVMLALVVLTGWLVGKALLFHTTEKLVAEQPWYQGGYRANIVAYSVSKLSQMVEEHVNTQVLDFRQLWAQQLVPAAHLNIVHI
jgi:hypothetical protein